MVIPLTDGSNENRMIQLQSLLQFCNSGHRHATHAMT